MAQNKQHNQLRLCLPFCRGSYIRSVYFFRKVQSNLVSNMFYFAA